MKVNRLLSLLLCAALVFALLPTAALAAGDAFIVTGDTAGYTYDASGVLTFTSPGSYTVSMAANVEQTETDRIVIDAPTSTEANPVRLTIDNVKITHWGDCALSDGKLYLYLPENTQTMEAQAADGVQPSITRTYTGTVTTKNDHTGAGTLNATAQLPAPTGLSWDGTIPGKATWSAVTNASSYTVQLYKGGAGQGSAVTGVTDTVYDFTSVITLAGSGDYTFKVTAIGDGSNYTDSDPSAESAVSTYTKWTSIGGGGGGSSSTARTGMRVTSSGGTFSENGVTLTFSAGAVENDIRVIINQISQNSDLNIPEGSQLLSRIMNIVKDKSDNFKKAVTITLSFDKSKINPDEYDIAIYYYDEDTGKWVALDNIKIDFATGKISGDTTHFTKFAVIATPKVKEEKRPETVTPPPAKNIPSDISAHWAKDSIATATAHNIISGYDENTFGPDDLITREQAAVIIARAAKLEAGTDELNFTDSQAISPWAKPGVAAAFKGGFITGYPDGSFKPQGNTSRAEAVSLILKVI